MSRGYGKYRRGGGSSSSHSSFHFDNLFKENTNKPSAARSAATVGKWGITSFTSIRTINGVSRSAPEPEKPAPPLSSSSSESISENTTPSAPKPKKFFKSRNSDPPDPSPLNYNSKSPPDLNYGIPLKKQKINESKTTNQAPRKFFSSKNNTTTTPEKTVLNVNNNKPPPIVLRICRGKSQLINDSDESESTISPTTSSTTMNEVTTASSTSPKGQPRSPNCRITRSARRSMQQDHNPSCSPATADTPTEFSLFTSPKQQQVDIEMSPQYIPAEKYEMERRAMYDNLLKANEDELSNEESPEMPQLEAESINNHVEEEENEPKLVKEDDLKIEEKEELKQQPPSTIEDDWDTDSDAEHQIDDSNQANQLANSANCDQMQLEQTNSDDASKTPDLLDELEDKSSQNAAMSSSSSSNTMQNEDVHQESVKLVISKKKGSIFKSRSLVNDGTKKRRALYKHKWSDDNKDGQKQNPNGADGKPMPAASVFDDEFDFTDNPLTRVTNTADDEDQDAVTSIKCAKSDKGYYTVVRNVKKAHQIQEIGEFQEFNDDVEYILDALQDNNPISTRCLSAITLAGKCMVPAFRMHVRAHGTVAKFFKALHDATKDQSLGLCTATVMFVLSQDRLNMDLDRDCLELMLNLLESDVSYQQALDVCGLSSAQLEKNKHKVKELCTEIQSQGHAIHLNLDNITVGQLAMETLLSLTSKRAGEWFKEELRELGGLEHIMKTICECCRQVSDYVVSWTDTLLDKLRKVDRCLRVLENVTHNNEENQTYLLNYNNGMILDTLVNLYKLCDCEIPLYPVTDISDKESTGTIIREALLVTLKVLINLTHHFKKQSMGSTLIGSRPGIIETSLHLLLQVPHYIPEQKKFELGVLVLMLLINLIQDNDANKKLLIDAKAPPKLESIYSRDEGAVEALIAQFYHWEGCAKIAEKRTNAILDGEKEDSGTNSSSNSNNTNQNKSNEEFIEETVAKLLQKAGTHMEYTFLASYIVMLIGFLIMDNKDYQSAVRQSLKSGTFVDMVELLKKFFNFMNLTASTEASSVCAIKATEKVIKYMEECDKALQSGTTRTNSTNAECIDLSYTMPH